MNMNQHTNATRSASNGTPVREDEQEARWPERPYGKINNFSERHRRSEKGNVLFIILIAIAMLASLSYAVTQSSRGGADAFTSERTSLLSDEIISYGNALASAVGQLRLRGCSTSQISFENNISALYTNGGAPADNSCHIFHPDGGGMTYQNIDSTALTSGGTGIYFDGSMAIENIGTTCASAACSDLAFYVRDLKQGVCDKLNNKLSITTKADPTPIDTAVDFDPFTGTYSYDLSLGDTTASAAIAGKKAACVQESGGDTNHFYRVLISR